MGAYRYGRDRISNMKIDRTKKQILWSALSVIVLGLLAFGIRHYSQKDSGLSCTKQLFAMDTVMSFTAYGKNCEEAVDAAVREVERLDELLSTGNMSSEVSGLNETGEGTISEDTVRLFQKSLDIYQATDGLFDFTVYPLMCLWGFPTKEYRVPEEEELKETLSLVDASKITMEKNKMHLGAGQQIDFGGIAKGYASDRVMEIYKEYGITSGMVSLGGNVQVLGKKPDNSAWRIGIRDPEGMPEEMAAVLEAENCAVVTSGGYERYFEEDGNTYIHILDPRTGYPVSGELASVTIISEDGALADALSTALYIMGTEDAASYWKADGSKFEMVLITRDGAVYATEGLKGRIETEREITIISKE